MKAQKLRSSLLALSCLLLSLFVMSGCGQSEQNNGYSTVSSTPTTAMLTATVDNLRYARSTNLVGASLEDVGRAAQRYTEGYLGTPVSATQVLLVRFLTPEQMPALGLPCRNYLTIETPPLALVVLRGDFDVNQMRGMSRAWQHHATHMIYIMDLWSGGPANTTASRYGGVAHKILNDPTLQEDYPGQFAEQDVVPPCPTHGPSAVHYGEVVPGGSPVPPDSPAVTAQPTTQPSTATPGRLPTTQPTSIP